MKNSLPLLLPGVIRTYTNKSNLLVDESLRLSETKKALQYTINQGLFKKIVICDGSNYPVLNQSEIAYYSSQGVAVEQLQFQQNTKLVNIHGKSNGECQIVNYALANSKLIKEAGGFYKLSSRYFFENIGQVYEKIQSFDNIFFNYNCWPANIRSPFIMTIFYKCSVEFYYENLLGSIDECTHDVAGYLESVFYKRLHLLNPVSISSPFPFFSGIAGTTGKSILNNHYKLRNLASHLGLLCNSF